MTNFEMFNGNDRNWTITFPITITDYTIYFTVKKSEDDSDEQAPIKKVITEHTDATSSSINNIKNHRKGVTAAHDTDNNIIYANVDNLFFSHSVSSDNAHLNAGLNLNGIIIARSDIRIASFEIWDKS